LYGFITADLHLIYFGDSFEGVSDADTDSPEFMTWQSKSETSWDPCDIDPLPFEKTFFWRVDEYDSDLTNIYKGEIWNFTTGGDPPPPPP
jgi:hypothetical protein